MSWFRKRGVRRGAEVWLSGRPFAALAGGSIGKWAGMRSEGPGAGRMSAWRRWSASLIRSARLLLTSSAWPGSCAAPGGWRSDQDERGIVIQWPARVPEQILTQALKQVRADVAGAGSGQPGEPGSQRIAPTARVAGFGHTVGVKKQRAAGPERQRPPGGAAVAQRQQPQRRRRRGDVHGGQRRRRLAGPAAVAAAAAGRAG